MQKNVTEGSVYQTLSLNQILSPKDQPIPAGNMNSPSDSSDRGMPNLGELQEKRGFFSNNKQHSSEQKAMPNDAIPEGLSLREAKSKGDCFYDACAQALNELFEKNNHTIKSLRRLCHQYAVDLDQRCGTNPKHPDNWIGKTLKESQYQHYLANVRYTVEEREAGEGLGTDKIAIWGRYDIDGRILCEELSIKLHVMAVIDNPNEIINQSQKHILSHHLVDNCGVKNIEEDNIVWSAKNIVHIAVRNLHFTPILRITTNVPEPLVFERNDINNSCPIILEGTIEARKSIDDAAQLSEHTRLDQPTQSEKTPKKPHYDGLYQEGAIEYFIDQLKELFLQRNNHFIGTFQNFVNVVPELYNNLPYNYESVLADIFWGRLQYDTTARVGLVQVFLNSLDATILSDYCNNLIEEELKTLSEKSSFRLKVEELYEKWADKLNAAKVNCLDYYEEAMRERVTQMEQLYNALTQTQVLPNATPNGTQENRYPDDELVKVVLSIIDHGNNYYSYFLAREYLWKESFAGFLKELKTINEDRLSKKLIAHDGTLVCQDFDVLLAVKTLHYENIRQPYYHRIFSLLQAMIIRNSKLIQRHYHVIQEQNDLVHEHMKVLEKLEINHAKEVAKLQKEILALQTSLINPITRIVHERPMALPNPRKAGKLEPVAPRLKSTRVIREPSPWSIECKQSEELNRLIDENTALKKKNSLLSEKLADAESRCASLPNIENDNKNLRRRLAQLERRLEALQLQTESSNTQKPAERLYNPNVKWQFPYSDHIHEDDETTGSNSDNEDRLDINQNDF